VSAVSSRIVGRVLDENSVPFDGLRVSVEEPGSLRGSEIGHGDTDSNGNFGFSYISDAWSGRVGTRQLEVAVKDPVLRELRRMPQAEPASDVFTLDTITISRPDVEGFEVTLGTGTAQLLSEHNAIAVKIDRAAFEHAAYLWVPKTRSRHATWEYSWIRPPSRSRRRTRTSDPIVGGPRSRSSIAAMGRQPRASPGGLAKRGPPGRH
jgi:hypothetical protein